MNHMMCIAFVITISPFFPRRGRPVIAELSVWMSGCVKSAARTRGWQFTRGHLVAAAAAPAGASAIAANSATTAAAAAAVVPAAAEPLFTIVILGLCSR